MSRRFPRQLIPALLRSRYWVGRRSLLRLGLWEPAEAWPRDAENKPRMPMEGMEGCRAQDQVTQEASCQVPWLWCDFDGTGDEGRRSRSSPDQSAQGDEGGGGYRYSDNRGFICYPLSTHHRLPYLSTLSETGYGARSRSKLLRSHSLVQEVTT